jgi:hypothetical protein
MLQARDVCSPISSSKGRLLCVNTCPGRFGHTLSHTIAEPRPPLREPVLLLDLSPNSSIFSAPGRSRAKIQVGLNSPFT